MDIPAVQAPKPRLHWIELLRFAAITGIVAHHGIQYATNFAYSPNGDGIGANAAAAWAGATAFGASLAERLFALVGQFGFQWLDAFILITGFFFLYAAKDNEDRYAGIVRKWLSLLSPFWTAVAVTLVLSIATHVAFGWYLAPAWNWAAAFLFPLTFDFHGSYLQAINGNWWYVPFALALIALSPALLALAKKFGTWRLFLGTLLVALAYRALSVFAFGGHPNYVIADTAAKELPFLVVLAKLPLVALGMHLAGRFAEWKALHGRAATFAYGAALWLAGTAACFFPIGWLFAEFAYAPGLFLMAWAAFGWHDTLGKPFWSRAATVGTLALPLFLIHNFFVDRLMNAGLQFAPLATLTIAFGLSVLAALFIRYAAARAGRALSRLRAACR